PDPAGPLAVDERHGHRHPEPIEPVQVGWTGSNRGASFRMRVHSLKLDQIPMTIPSTTPRLPEVPASAPPAADPVVLSTRGLSVWYGSSLALKDISIDIPRHQITALIGPSGCGKSTLLRCFNRMNDLIAGARMVGEVRFDGRAISTPDTDPVALRRRIG